MPAEQRRADRRERLIAAGIEEVGSAGWHGLTVRAVCSRAKLTERYFYESFDDREALLFAVFDAVVADAATLVWEAISSAPHDAEERARAAIAAFVDAIADEPHRARIMLVEGTGSDALDERRRAAIGGFARIVRDAAADFYGVSGSGMVDTELTAHAMVGSVAQLLSAWLSGEIDVPRARLVEHCTQLFVAAAQVSSAPQRDLT